MDRVAIITGASQGLGLALAKDLAGRGYSLAIDARRADRLAAAEVELAALTPTTAVAGDITDPEHQHRLVAAAATLGAIAVIVNNASTLGASPLPRLDDLDAATLRDTFETNVVAPLALYQLAAPHLAAGAVIVNITSDAAVEGYAGSAVCSPPSATTSASSPSTRETCAPRCTRTPSPARTSATDHRLRRACPGSSR
jgi:NADP-dependent 3-hydroxy acid dehydrogenase YdfG